MKVHYFTGMSVEDTKKYSDKIEDLIDHEWRGKAARLQNRRWRKIAEEERSLSHNRLRSHNSFY